LTLSHDLQLQFVDLAGGVDDIRHFSTPSCELTG
jgi:hypothetical protein